MDCRFCRPLSIIIIPFNWAFVKLWVVASLRLFPDRYLECSFSVLLVKCRAPTSVASWARQRIDLLVKAEGVQGDSDWRATQSVCIAYPWWLRWWSVCPQCGRSRFHPCVGRSLEKEMATHSSTLAWKIPWTEEPGRLQAWDRKESNTTERLHFSFFQSVQDCIQWDIDSGALVTPKIHGAKMTLWGNFLIPTGNFSMNILQQV